MRHWRITRNSKVVIQTGSTYISDSMTDIMQFRRQTRGFWPRPERRNWPRAIAMTTDNRKLQSGRFARQSRNLWQSVVVAIIWLILCRARHHRTSQIWRGYLDAICHSSRDVIISCFEGHIDISGSRSVLYTYLPTIFHTCTRSYTTVSLEF